MHPPPLQPDVPGPEEREASIYRIAQRQEELRQKVLAKRTSFYFSILLSDLKLSVSVFLSVSTIQRFGIFPFQKTFAKTQAKRSKNRRRLRKISKG